jgi:methylated-DNA-[protein]-cysteine S-methyltransferase
MRSVEAAADRSFSTIPSPAGELLLLSDGVGLTGVYPATHRELPDVSGLERDEPFFSGVKDQLDAYFRGRLFDFEVTLAFRGTEFQRQVWQALSAVPCGITRSYLEIAEHVGRPSAARAVGTAIGRNPISIIIPCHRIIGTTGSLTGYAGGLALKRWLLEHEASAASWRVQTPRGTSAISRQRAS